MKNVRCAGFLRVLAGAVVCVAAMVAPAQAAAQEQRVYPVGHPVYLQLERAFRDAGMVLPDTAYPASGAQLRRAVSLLDSASLSPLGEYYADEVLRILDGWDGAAPVLAEPADGFSLVFDPQLNLELRLDDSRPGKQVLDEPLDVLLLESRAAMGPVFGQMDFMVRQEPFHGYLAGESWSNLPGRLEWMDFNFPRRGFLAAGAGPWSVQIGRDRLAWGSSHSGSLTLSGEPEYLEFVRLSGLFRRFSYTGVFLRLEPYAREDELPEPGSRYYPPIFVGDSDSDYAEFADAEGHYRAWRKSIVKHRFTFVPHDRVRFSLMESTGIGGHAPDLRMFNPFMILHNHYDFSLMTFATSAELTLAPMRGLELYGQWYMNDFMLPQERDAGAQEPNAMAWLAGVHYQRPVAAGLPGRLGGVRPMAGAGGAARGSAPMGLLTLGGEFYFADPYVYIRESVLRSFTYRHRVHTNYDGSGGESLGNIDWHDGFLGSPFGNDSMAWVVFAGFELPSLGSLEVEFLRHHDGPLGPADILVPGEEAVERTTPSGTPEYISQLTGVLQLSSRGIAGLDAALAGGRAGSWTRGLELTLGLTGRLQWIENLAHASGDDVFRGGAGASLGARWRR
ncbi:hypothetical protein [Spirochaeta africana]|uniref:Capsule assembly protein Wzi n=1 Tax=Spirochaeta africana (strain ATCC 700263 / DSM 8902 / Z-7692) TaxID=889378 RepID=H9UF94_SPIAZ|nr:hypothetical protein [Spirochaeta africana]AFG36187.1 hypothetical protein Spiaf_0078 [Spirochaeta africana DSM 8902]